MALFEFLLSDDDWDRLKAIKKFQGKDNMTFNSFAAELLSHELYMLFPARPVFDDDGNCLNEEKYRGSWPSDTSSL